MEESLPKMIDARVKELTKIQVPIYVDSSVTNYMSSHILHVHPTQASQAYTQEQRYQLYLTMKDNPQLQHDDLPIWLALKIKFEGIYASNTPCRSSAIHLRDQDDPHDDAHLKGENSAKRQKTSKHGTYVFRESSSGQANKSKPGPSTSGDEILTSPFPLKPTPVVQSCQRDPKAPALSLVNQDLLYLMKGNSVPEKFVLSLHKFPVVIFPGDDIEERTFRWVDKCVKKVNPYARYSVKHWKNPHANIFYIKRQKEPGKPKEEVYSNLKNVQVIKTYGELGHEHKFVTEIIVRRENDSIVSITEPDYTNLNKNNIEDMYLLCVNGKVEDYAETGLLWSLLIFIRSIVIWERVYDFQLGVESYQ
ncbi:hypothetical protein Tco_1119268 [Tanacetum coccineum]